MTTPSVKVGTMVPLEVGGPEEEEELKLSEAAEAAIKGALFCLHHSHLFLHITCIFVSLIVLEMCHTEFCRPDQELTAQINELFPTEQSLAQLDTVIGWFRENLLSR